MCPHAKGKGIACALRKLKVYEKNYSTHDLELVAVVFNYLTSTHIKTKKYDHVKLHFDSMKFVA